MNKLVFSTLTTILTLFLISSSIALFAQGGQGGGMQGGERPAIGILKGKVIDQSTKEPVEYATISIHNLRDSSLVTGGITDAKGSFNITEIQLGMYFVKVGFIGYDAKIISPIKLSPKGDGIEQDLGEIILGSSSQQIKEVDVVAEKMVVTNAIDKKVFNVSQSFASNVSSASEILQNIPSVDVDIDGNVSLRGSGNVRILIDGKPSGLSSADLMQQIPASSIESIEVITNPSAKYDPEGMSGIINIVLKKNKLTGFNGMVTVNASPGNMYTGGGQISYKNKNLNLYANYNMRDMDHEMTSDIYRESYYNGETTILDQTGERLFNMAGQMFKVGMDYSFNDKNTISLSSLINTRNFNANSYTSNSYLDGNHLITNTSERNSINENGGGGYDLTLNYLKKFADKGHELSFDANFSNFNMESNGSYNETFTPVTDILLQKDFGTVDRNAYQAQLDYVKTKGDNSKFEAGLKFQNTDIRTIYSQEAFDYDLNSYVEDPDLADDFNYNEKIAAAYAIYGKKVGNFSFQAGLRVEQTATDFTLMSTNDHYINDYFAYYPSAHVQWEKQKGETLQLSYSKRVNRPQGRSLNPRVRYDDPLNLSKGNPYLMPEYINSVEFGYMRYWEKISITSSVYYRQIVDMIAEITTVDADGISMTTYENIASGSNYGFELVFNASPYKWWNLTLSTNIYRSTIDGSNLEVAMNNEGTIYTTKLMSTWKIQKLFDVQLSGRYRGPQIMAQGEMEDEYSFDLSLKRQFLKNRLTATIRISDLLDSELNTSTMSSSNYYQTSERKRESRFVYGGLAYTFGKLSQQSKKKRGDMEEGNGGMMDMD